jgi:hypothetical protein
MARKRSGGHTEEIEDESKEEAERLRGVSMVLE